MWVLCFPLMRCTCLGKTAVILLPGHMWCCMYCFVFSEENIIAACLILIPCLFGFLSWFKLISAYLKVCASLFQLLLPTGVMVEVIMVNIVSAGHIFVQQHTHPTYHALRSLDQQMFLCYSQPGTPALPSPVEGKHSLSFLFFLFFIILLNNKIASFFFLKWVRSNIF